MVQAGIQQQLAFLLCKQNAAGQKVLQTLPMCNRYRNRGVLPDATSSVLIRHVGSRLTAEASLHAGESSESHQPNRAAEVTCDIRKIDLALHPETADESADTVRYGCSRKIVESLGLRRRSR